MTEFQPLKPVHESSCEPETAFARNEELEMWMFLHRKIHNRSSGTTKKLRTVSKYDLWGEFKSIKNGQRKRKESEYVEWFDNVMARNLHKASLGIKTTIELYYGLEIPVEDNFLKYMTLGGDVKVNEAGCLMSYKEKKIGGMVLEESSVEIEAPNTDLLAQRRRKRTSSLSIRDLRKNSLETGGEKSGRDSVTREYKEEIESSASERNSQTSEKCSSETTPQGVVPRSASSRTSVAVSSEEPENTGAWDRKQTVPETPICSTEPIKDKSTESNINLSPITPELEEQPESSSTYYQREELSQKKEFAAVRKWKHINYPSMSLGRHGAKKTIPTFVSRSSVYIPPDDEPECSAAYDKRQKLIDEMNLLHTPPDETSDEFSDDSGVSEERPRSSSILSKRLNFVDDYEYSTENVKIAKKPFTPDEELYMWMFLLQKIRNSKTGIAERAKVSSSSALWKEYEKSSGRKREANEYMKRFELIMAPFLHSTRLVRQMKIELYYGLALPVEEKFLKELRADAHISLDERGCIVGFREKRTDGKALTLGVIEQNGDLKIREEKEETQLIGELLDNVPVKRKRGRPRKSEKAIPKKVVKKEIVEDIPEPTELEPDDAEESDEYQPGFKNKKMPKKIVKKKPSKSVIAAFTDLDNVRATQSKLAVKKKSNRKRRHISRVSDFSKDDQERTSHSKPSGTIKEEAPGDWDFEPDISVEKSIVGRRKIREINYDDDALLDQWPESSIEEDNGDLYIHETAKDDENDEVMKDEEQERGPFVDRRVFLESLMSVLSKFDDPGLDDLRQEIEEKIRTCEDGEKNPSVHSIRRIINSIMVAALY